MRFQRWSSLKVVPNLLVPFSRNMITRLKRRSAIGWVSWHQACQPVVVGWRRSQLPAWQGELETGTTSPISQSWSRSRIRLGIVTVMAGMAEYSTGHSPTDHRHFPVLRERGIWLRFRPWTILSRPGGLSLTLREREGRGCAQEVIWRF